MLDYHLLATHVFSLSFLGKHNASAGNPTRVTSMATMYSATRPLMLCLRTAVKTSYSEHLDSREWLGLSRALTACLWAMIMEYAPGVDKASNVLRAMHQPGVEPGSHRWQRCILPLDH